MRGCAVSLSLWCIALVCWLRDHWLRGRACRSSSVRAARHRFVLLAGRSLGRRRAGRDVACAERLPDGAGADAEERGDAAEAGTGDVEPDGAVGVERAPVTGPAGGAVAAEIGAVAALRVRARAVVGPDRGRCAAGPARVRVGRAAHRAEPPAHQSIGRHGARLRDRSVGPRVAPPADPGPVRTAVAAAMVRTVAAGYDTAPSGSSTAQRVAGATPAGPVRTAVATAVVRHAAPPHGAPAADHRWSAFSCALASSSIAAVGVGPAVPVVAQATATGL